MSLGPIPGSAIRSFARDNGVTGDWLDSFTTVIRKLDREYLRLLTSGGKRRHVVRGDDIDGVRNMLGRMAKQKSE